MAVHYWYYLPYALAYPHHVIIVIAVHFLSFTKFMLFYTGGDVFTADCDQQLMPILEMLYNASRRTSNQIYMLLIILLILSQDSSFNASIHKLVRLVSYFVLNFCINWCLLILHLQMLPNVPWYQERLLHNTSLGSLMVVILIRTVKYNLSKLRVRHKYSICFPTWTMFALLFLKR